MAGAPIPNEDCDACDDCEDPCPGLTTSVATVGLCLTDSTPIAVVVTRTCEGITTEDGWIDLTNGIFTAGNPPAGTVSCASAGGDDYDFALSGWLCDILPDGSIAGIALVQIERDSSGAVIGITLIGVNGLPYVPVGIMTRCPEDRLAAEVLCDAGAANVPFVRFYTYSPSGIIPSRNTNLDGAPYLVVGPVVRCDEAVTVLNPRDDNELEILCDSGNANLPFLRRYNVDAAGAVTTDDTELDGVTPYVFVGPEARCEAVTGSVSATLTNQFDDEYQILCDSTPTTFLRRLRTDAAGVVTVANFTLAGGAFVPIGAVGACAGVASITNLRDDEYLILCDTVTNFLRRYRSDSAGVITITNTTFDGTTAYVPVGAVGRCSQAVTGTIALSNQFDDEWAILCDSTPTTFLRRLRTDSAGVVTVANFTLAGGAFAPIGAVGLCSSPAAVTNRRDTFDEILCDTVGPFLRRYTVNDAGVVSITNTTLDGTTAYVTVGAVAKCFETTDFVVVLCDSGGPFVRRYHTSSTGALTVTNFTLAGGAYVPVGTVLYCGGRNTTSIIVSRPNGAVAAANTRVTSTLARRVTIIWENNSALAARPTVNGVALYSTGTGGGDADPSWFIIGDLAAGGTLPAITVVCNEAGDDLTVIEEL